MRPHFFDEQDWFSESVWEIARRLSRARYYDNIIADAERGAGPGLATPHHLET